MLEYRLSVDEDEIDDYDEETNLNVDDDLGDYGMDDEDEMEEVGSVTETVVVVPPPAPIEETMEAPPAKMPVKRAAAPPKAAKKKAAAK